MTQMEALLETHAYGGGQELARGLGRSARATGGKWGGACYLVWC